MVARKPRPPTYGCDAVKVLQQVWVVAGQPCGKYLAAVMGTTLVSMEAHTGSDTFNKAWARFSSGVRAKLLAMNPFTIDRLLTPFKLSAPPPGSSLPVRSRRNQYMEAVPIMSRIPDIYWPPALVAIDTVAHCGNNDKGQYAFILTAANVFTG
ncbi:hypothetical protein [Arthrobacter psychrolactophilus]|uniref:hypothetical protein n=1 Tax=Arthrobacter psychrolactophilus TaxID=92442 RepID=UPI0011B48E62|nr:hypothetical protein [Arthrobacter psychrolactophilus]